MSRSSDHEYSDSIRSMPGVAVEDLRDLVVETRRPSGGRPAEVTIAVSDEIVKALRGKPEAGPQILLVAVSRET